MRGPRDLLEAVIADTAATLTRLEGRTPSQGVHEWKELGPALVRSYVRLGIEPSLISDRERLGMAHWNRTESEVDLVVRRPNGGVEAVAELKAWDIGHQLFDLAKVCCLLSTGIPHGFLICVAKRDADFARARGGELFSPDVGERRLHGFEDLISRHADEWKTHVGKGTPEPTSVPAVLATTAVSAGHELVAYPGHSMRAVEVEIVDATPIPLRDGWPG